MAAKDRSVYEIFTIRSNDGAKTIDLRGGIVSFSYFENVFSPMITAQVLITSTGNVITDEDGDLVSIYNGLPLRGQRTKNNSRTRKGKKKTIANKKK